MLDIVLLKDILHIVHNISQNCVISSFLFFIQLLNKTQLIFATDLL